MKILLSESVDKKKRIIEDIPYNIVLENLNKDNNWIEVIDAYNQHNKLRLFFDIDGYDLKEDPLKKGLEELNSIFNSSNEDWAISCGNRENKYSYHILSKKYCIELSKLRIITSNLNSKYKWFDHTLLFISMFAIDEYLFFRLPNQSKNSMNSWSNSL
jgi:hypothetical protein